MTIAIWVLVALLAEAFTLGLALATAGDSDGASFGSWLVISCVFWLGVWMAS